MSGRPLRVCFVAYRGNPRCGGQGIYLWFLARELARAGPEVDVLVGPPYPDPMPFARDVRRLRNDRFWGKWFERDQSAFFDDDPPLTAFSPFRFYELAASRLGFLPEPALFSLRAFRALAERRRRGQGYDVIHDVQCLGWGLLGVRALGSPVVATVHHPLSVDRRASFQRDQSLSDAIGTAKFYPVGMQAFVARRLDRILTSSEASARRIRRDFGVPSNQVRMVGNGLDTEWFRPDPSVPRSASEILCVARASDPNKGVRTAVEALRHLPKATRLTLVDDLPESHGLWKQARKWGVADRIDCVGSLSNEALLRLYRRATLVVVPSLYEGFGLPAAEAMACETPVVASRAGALPEVVRTGEGGLLAPPGDAVGLASAVRTLLDQPDLRRRLGARARARIQAAYSWPRIAVRTAEVYAELLDRSGRRRGRPARTTTSARAGNRAAAPSSA